MKKILVKNEIKPIHQFCRNGSIKLLKYIIPKYTKDKTFDINALQKGTQNTALHVICSRKDINYDIVYLLIENGARINAQNKDKHTPLDLLIKNKNKYPNICDIKHNIEQLLRKHNAMCNTQKPKAKANDPRLKEYLNMLKI
eukprot:158586_1